MPEPVSVLHRPNTPRAIEVAQLPGRGPTLLCGAGGGNLQVYDVSDSAAPVHRATFETPGRAARVSLSGSLAFVADSAAGVQVVDLSTPAAPKLVGGCRTQRPARDVAAVGSLVFVVTGDGEPRATTETC